MKTNTLPPIEILDVLHMAEGKGIELPEAIDEWWKKETCLMQRKDLDKRNQNKP